MGLEYLKTVHGWLSLLQFLLGMLAMFTGFFIWHEGDVFFLFFLGNMPMLTLVLMMLLAAWVVSAAIMLNQILGRDVLEQLGKTKTLLLHGLCALVLLLAAVIESYYFGLASREFYYLPRLTIVMISCWMLALTFMGQLCFVVFQ